MSEKMTIKKDLQCVLNMPEKIQSEFDNEHERSNSLPPYAPAKAYPVDEYEGCPANWMHGSDMASSYFLGVKENYGMWLDFNECFYHTHDVAVVISIQGINPITGQKMVGNNPLRLEQYHKKCPIHGTLFKQDRFCEKCGFKWPGQNYLATTGTPEMKMWLDGFRSSDGNVRQYIITEDKMRGVASQMIGEDRVFAIGIAYYLSKKKKPNVIKRQPERLTKDYHAGSSAMFWDQPPAYMGYIPDSTGTPLVLSMTTISSSENCRSSFSNPDVIDIQYDRTLYQLGPDLTQKIKVNESTKKLEIGAGALIEQRVYDDPKLMEYWEEKPAGMIYINYCDEITLKKILDQGRRADEKDGFMKGIKVGG